MCLITEEVKQGLIASPHLVIQPVSSTEQRLGEVQQLGAPGRVEAATGPAETGTWKHIWTGQVQTLNVGVPQPVNRPRPATAPPLSTVSLSIKI